MQHGAGAGDGVENLQMAMGVPSEGAVHLAVQLRCQSPRAFGRGGVMRAHCFAVAERYDFRRAEVCRAMLQHGGQRQGEILV